MGLVREMGGMRANAQRQELCFKKCFLVWEFDFTFTARTGMAWTMCRNSRLEFFQDQASTFWENSSSQSALRSLVGPQLLLLALAELPQAQEPFLFVSSNVRGSGISCSCDDRGLLDHSAKLSRSYADSAGGEGKILPPRFRGITELKFWEVSQEISQVRGKFLPSKPAKVSRSQQPH